jgi:hypothetical protein
MEVRYSMPVVATGALTCLRALGNSGRASEKAIGVITHGSHQDAFRHSGANWLQ